ncbi:MAG TPA: hypothetical protein GX401_07695 [Clostridiales bacterium]|nr:hypothetical protein [Clostridiales bacterium]
MSENKNSYNPERRGENRRREQAKRRKRNRIIMIVSAVALLALLIWAISAIFGSCANSVNIPVANSSVTGSAATTAPTAQLATQAPTLPPTAAVSAIADNGEDGVMTDSGVYLWDNKAFEMFYGSDDMAKYYASAMTSYKNTLGSGITVYDMIAPSHVEFGLPNRLKDEIGTVSQRDITTTAYNALKADIKKVDIYDTLAAHANEYLYFNTDHHWTGLGAYYAYTKFAEVAGFTPTDINTLTSHTINDFVGSLYTATEEEVLQQNPDIVVYYDIPGDYTTQIMNDGSDELVEVGDLNYGAAGSGGNSYGVYLWGDNPLTVIKHTTPANNRKILVVKESYGNAFVPFLVNNYDEVHAIDFRYYSGNIKDYCTQNGITEVLFLNGVMSASNSYQVDSTTALIQN